MNTLLIEFILDILLLEIGCIFSKKIKKPTVLIKIGPLLKDGMKIYYCISDINPMVLVLAKKYSHAGVITHVIKNVLF